MHQAVMLAFNILLGLPAFLLVRRDMAKIRAEMREDEAAESSEADPPADSPPLPAEAGPDERA
ncbi:MAG: hypothetical protein ACYTGB_09520 [Planctomycetota bacterium]|jgi:hypothetical protein